MPASLVRLFRLLCGILIAAVVLPWLALPAGADALADFHASVQQASARYRTVMTTLETRGREETSAEVARFRQAWQALVSQFESRRPAELVDHDQYAGLFMQVEARIVGAMIVIDIGSREAARDALAPIDDALSRLRVGSAPGR